MTLNIYTDKEGHIRTKKYNPDFYDEHPRTKKSMKEKGFSLTSKIIIPDGLELDLLLWKKSKIGGID